jgi:hypothetical protein
MANAGRLVGCAVSGAGNWRQRIWIWPLPPTGRLAFVCEWPAAGVPLTRHEIDAQLILDATARAQLLFNDDELADTPAAHTTVSFKGKAD